MNNNLPTIVREDTFLVKIFKFFKSLFKKKETEIFINIDKDDNPFLKQEFRIKEFTQVNSTAQDSDKLTEKIEELKVVEDQTKGINEEKVIEKEMDEEDAVKEEILLSKIEEAEKEPKNNNIEVIKEETSESEIEEVKEETKDNNIETVKEEVKENKAKAVENKKTKNKVKEKKNKKEKMAEMIQMIEKDPEMLNSLDVQQLEEINNYYISKIEKSKKNVKRKTNK